MLMTRRMRPSTFHVERAARARSTAARADARDAPDVANHVPRGTPSRAPAPPHARRPAVKAAACPALPCSDAALFALPRAALHEGLPRSHRVPHDARHEARVTRGSPTASRAPSAPRRVVAATSLT